MSIQSVGFKAYASALQNFAQAERKMQTQTKETGVKNDFGDILTNSLEKVNDLQSERSQLITSFASGQNQNVHELMIAMQKASISMSMTSAVRNKVIEAYKELSRMQF